MTRVITSPPPPPSARIILCVEDPPTQVYLSECWGLDPDFALVPVFGNENVRAVVETAARDGVSNVFGFRDRDFGTTNRADWSNRSATRVLRSEVHELENYLLDEVALSSCVLNTAGRTEQEIAARMQGVAARLPWWMACRQVLADIQTALTHGFPQHPPYERITDHAAAVAYITTHPWYLDLQNRVLAITSAPLVTAGLADAHARCFPMLAGGQWKQHYSGKEVFRNLRDWVFPDPGPRGEARDAELARAVARRQLQLGRVPQEVVDLRVALRTRVGI